MHGKANIHLDSSALCLTNRKGPGKAKQNLQHLLIQHVVRASEKVSRNVNPDLLMTKQLTKDKIEQLMKIMNFRYMRHQYA